MIKKQPSKQHFPHITIVAVVAVVAIVILVIFVMNNFQETREKGAFVGEAFRTAGVQSSSCPEDERSEVDKSKNLECNTFSFTYQNQIEGNIKTPRQFCESKGMAVALALMEVVVSVKNVGNVVAYIAPVATDSEFSYGPAVGSGYFYDSKFVSCCKQS